MGEMKHTLSCITWKRKIGIKWSLEISFYIFWFLCHKKVLLKSLSIPLMTKTGIQGLSPGGGCKGAEPPCLGKFCISELNSRDLVHTFYQHYIENLFIYFQ